ncbi:MAG: hypothetical protein GTN78_03815, partial [Gemmatimonadales bacterium]|nr:hypothetical protein [Gemmatimonadales bacterium]
GQPKEAYLTAFELDFRDIGYARDATGMMAAMISAALSGEADAKLMVETGLETDPFGFGERKYDQRIMASEVKGFI